jgi:hypothetical protein
MTTKKKRIKPEALFMLEKIPAKHRKAIARLVTVQANKDAQKPDVVVRSMRRARREQAITATRALAPILAAPTRRGELALSMMSDSEWSMLTSGDE